jgi:hypothetical protein
MRRQPKIDPGPEEIATWQQWFARAHTERLAALLADESVSPTQHDRELEDCLKLGDAAAARMRDDYLRRTGQS